MATQKEKSAQTRRTLLNAALLTFQRKGIEKTTIKDIVEEARVTRGAFYWHFANKEDLMRFIVDRFIEEDRQLIRDILEGTGSWQKFATALKDFFNNLIIDKFEQQYFCIFCLKDGVKRSSSNLNNAMLNHEKMWKTALYQIIKKAEDEGDLLQGIDHDWAYLYLQTHITGIFHLLIGATPEEKIKEYMLDIIDSAVEYIRDSPMMKR